MAFYVLILKESEDQTTAIYRFGPNREQMGRLTFDKSTGQADELDRAPVNEHHHLFVRASAKIYKHWLEGELPEKTVWAS